MADQADPVDPAKLPGYLATLSFEHRKSKDDWLKYNVNAQNAFWGATQVLSTLKSGDTDPWSGLTIDTVIRKSTRYIVYVDSELDIQWLWLTRPDEVAVGLVQARIGQLTKESSFLLIGRPRWVWFGPFQVRREDRYLAKEIRCVMGEALALALNGGSQDSCEAVLDEAKRYIAIAKDQKTRPVFVAGFLLVVALLGGVLTAWLCRFAQCCANQLDYPFVTGWLEAAVAGSAGALISSLLRTRDLGLEPAAQTTGLLTEAVARALIGAGSGVLVSFAFDSGMLLKGALQGTGETACMLRLFLCFASGVSERMLPALVGRAESLIISGSGNSTTAQHGR